MNCGEHVRRELRDQGVGDLCRVLLERAVRDAKIGADDVRLGGGGGGVDVLELVNVDLDHPEPRVADVVDDDCRVTPQRRSSQVE